MSILMVLLWDDGCVKSCVSPGPKRCACTLSKSSPALWYHVFHASSLTLASTATLFLPSERSGNTCICQNGGNMEKKELFPPMCAVQPWRTTPATAITTVDDWTVWANAFLCVNKDTADEKQLVSEEKWWIVKVSERGGSSLSFGTN